MTDTRPIIFSGPKLRALIEGRKTQTRRLVKPQPVKRGAFWEFAWGAGCTLDHLPVVPCHATEAACPYGQPGDLLWVREASLPDFPKAFSYYDWTWREVPEEYRLPKHVLYRASYSDPSEIRWHPSIHMPRWASRLTLRLTDVRVQRVQEISETDALAEGIRELPLRAGEPGAWWCADPLGNSALHCRTPRNAFCRLWESINGPAAWNSNPWVWALTFEVLLANVDAVAKQAA